MGVLYIASKVGPIFYVLAPLSLFALAAILAGAFGLLLGVPPETWVRTYIERVQKVAVLGGIWGTLQGAIGGIGKLGTEGMTDAFGHCFWASIYGITVAMVCSIVSDFIWRDSHED